MKRLLGLVFLFCFSVVARAQDLGSRNYDFSLGIGAATNYYDDYRSSAGAGIRLSAETPVKSAFGGILKLGLSGIFSGTNAGYETPFFRAKYYWRNALAGRAVFAYPFSTGLQGYAGLHLGFRSTQFFYTSNGVPGSYVVPDYSRVHLLGGVFIGVDYQWTNKFFIFSEAGYDQLWFTLGVKLKV